MSRKRFVGVEFFLALVLVLGLACTAVVAGVSALIRYQGVLAAPDGTPVPDADYEVQFAIYDSAT